MACDSVDIIVCSFCHEKYIETPKTKARFKLDGEGKPMNLCSDSCLEGIDPKVQTTCGHPVKGMVATVGRRGRSWLCGVCLAFEHDFEKYKSK